MGVAFRLLGEIEADIDGRPVSLGHARQRCVLAVLLVTANQLVTVDQLVDRVWGECPPQRARETVYSYLSRLRRLLAAGGVGTVRRSGGYALAVDPLAVDLHRFRRLVVRARAAGDADLFEQALELWRGEAFAGLDTAWLSDLRLTLHRERLAAELDRDDLALARGQHAELIGELAARHAAYPLDERLVGQLLLALYRCGRQAEALERYQRLRLRLAEELGADPSPTLRRLHRQILTGDPALAVPARSPSPAVPRQLPAPPPRFTGRARELAELTGAMAAQPDRAGTVPICAIAGAGGVGKTWLALRWAHEHQSRFPDGQLYVNLRGFDPAGEPLPAAVAVSGFLAALGAPAAAAPADLDGQAALLRSLTAGKRMLVVLDNARDSSQVLPLLPGGPDAAVLVTSRHTLAGLVAHGARPLLLDVLDDADARDLLGRQLGAERVAAEPEPVADLLGHCAGLPLALGVVAARATIHPELPLAALAQELADAPTRLDALDAGELSVNLRAVLSSSHRALGDDAARVFALLGLAPGAEIGLPAAASLTALPAGRARTLLRELVDAHLVHEPVPGRYRMHDLVRLYAGELAHDEERRAAVHRVLDHYLLTAGAASRALTPDRDPIPPPRPQPGVRPEPVTDHGAALAWFSAEHRGLVAAVAHAASAGFDRHAWQLASTLHAYLSRHGHWHDQVTSQRTAVSAAGRLADLPAQAHAHRGLGRALIWLRRYPDAGTQLQRARELFDRLGDPLGQAHARRSLARLYAQQGRYREALPYDQEALALYRAAGNRRGEAAVLNAIGWHHAKLGDYLPALGYCRQAIVLFRRIGERHGQAFAWHSLGYARLQLGQRRQAVHCHQRALELFREFDDRYYQGVVGTSLGDAHHAAGAGEAARGAWLRALRVFETLGADPAADRDPAKLVQVDGGAGSGAPAAVIAE